MQQILLTLSQDEIIDSESESSSRASLLEELLDLTEGLGKPRDMIIALDGGRVLLKILLKTSYIEVRQRCSEVLCSTVQNSADLQHYILTIGGMDIISEIERETNMKNKEALLTVLSSMIRGEYLDGKRRFIEQKGIEFILKLISNSKENSIRLIQKASFLLKDLVFYDDRLHLSVTNTDVFANTNAIGKHSQLLEGVKDNKGLKIADPNVKFNNEEEENKPFKDIVKKTLFDLDIFNILKDELNIEGNINVERRNCALRILHQLLEFDKSKVKNFDKVIKIIFFLLKLYSA